MPLRLMWFNQPVCVKITWQYKLLARALKKPPVFYLGLSRALGQLSCALVVIMLSGLLATAPAKAAKVAGKHEAGLSIQQVTPLIASAEPGVPDKTGWARDLLDALQENSLPLNKENVCAMIAVIDQESGFAANPIMPQGTGKRALINKLNEYTRGKGTQILPLFEEFFSTFSRQVENAKTEKDIDLAYRGLIVNIQKLPFWNAIGQKNPIDTIGSMQVAVSFAVKYEAYKHGRGQSLNDEWRIRNLLYTRKGGLYYGAAQLLAYETGYEKKLYRFADFNAGRYASRNAAFQDTVVALLGKKLALDGDLLSYDSAGNASEIVSNSESAIRELSGHFHLGLSDTQIRTDLLEEKTYAFNDTRTYKTVVRLYKKQKGAVLAYARLPDIALKSEKFSKSQEMTTAIFAKSVKKRYQQCVMSQPQI